MRTDGEGLRVERQTQAERGGCRGGRKDGGQDGSRNTELRSRRWHPPAAGHRKPRRGQREACALRLACNMPHSQGDALQCRRLRLGAQHQLVPRIDCRGTKSGSRVKGSRATPSPARLLIPVDQGHAQQAGRTADATEADFRRPAGSPGTPGWCCFERPPTGTWPERPLHVRDAAPNPSWPSSAAPGAQSGMPL